MEEIKEILKLDQNCDYKKLSVDEIVILENYITNLQEEIIQTKLLKEKYQLQRYKYKTLLNNIKEMILIVHDDEFYINLSHKEKVLYDILKLLEEVE